jgi:mRNA-degrading endonuclease YafQ of YafQ-DinJ toxin-antitoxin module
MINLIWGSRFKRAYRRTVKAHPHLKDKIAEYLEVFADDPFHPPLRVHKLSGKLKGLWAFVVEYDCRVVFRFLEDGNALLIDIGKHDEVY